MKKISILAILPSYSGGGAERVILNFLNNLNKSDFQYFLLMQNTLGPLKDDSYANNVTDFKAKRFRSAVLKIIKKINNIKPDIILSTFPHITLTLLFLRIFLPRNSLIVSRIPNMVDPSLNSNLFSLIIKFLHKIYMPKSDIIIVTSEAMRQDFISRGVDSNKIHLIHNPIDSCRIRKVKKLKRFSGRGLRIVFVGRLVFQKGLDIILPLLDKIKDIHLTIIGEGVELSTLTTIVKKYGIEEKVQFLGYLNDINGYIAAADYLVLPSRWEGLPNVALESLALGTPVITFRQILGLKDMILYTPPGALNFCKDKNEFRLLLKKLPVRKDYENPRLRENLIKKLDNPKIFTEKLSEVLRKYFFESKK